MGEFLIHHKHSLYVDDIPVPIQNGSVSCGLHIVLVACFVLMWDESILPIDTFTTHRAEELCAVMCRLQFMLLAVLTSTDTTMTSLGIFPGRPLSRPSLPPSFWQRYENAEYGEGVYDVIVEDEIQTCGSLYLNRFMSTKRVPIPRGQQDVIIL